MNKRITEAFAKEKAFIPFVTCGDPSLDVTEKIVYAMEEAGADLIELGIPFSDPQGQIADGFQQHHQLFITLLDDRSQLVAVDVHLREQPLEVVFAVRPDCGTFNAGKNTAQGFIEIAVLPGLEPHIVEQLGRQDIEPLFTHDLFAPVFRILVTQQRVVEIFIPGPRFLGIQITGQILGQKPIK